MRLVLAGLIVVATVVGCGSAPPSTTGDVATPSSSPSAAGATGQPTRPLPTPLPTTASSGMPAGSLLLPDGTAIPLVLDDASNLRAALRPATESEQSRGERSLAPDADSAIVKLAPGELLLTWVGTVCERGYSITISARNVATIAPAARPGCDLGRVIFAAVLTLPRSTDVASFTVDLLRPQLTG
jgi:hypothetical protein